MIAPPACQWPTRRLCGVGTALGTLYHHRDCPDVFPTLAMTSRRAPSEVPSSSRRFVCLFPLPPEPNRTKPNRTGPFTVCRFFLADLRGQGMTVARNTVGLGTARPRPGTRTLETRPIARWGPPSSSFLTAWPGSHAHADSEVGDCQSA